MPPSKLKKWNNEVSAVFNEGGHTWTQAAAQAARRRKALAAFQQPASFQQPAAFQQPAFQQPAFQQPAFQQPLDFLNHQFPLDYAPLDNDDIYFNPFNQQPNDDLLDIPFNVIPQVPLPQVPAAPPAVKPKAPRKPRAVKPKCKDLTKDICYEPRCRWILPKGKLPARCGNKARTYVSKQPKIPRCSTIKIQPECPIDRCRWLPVDIKRNRPERCANKVPKARTYKPITRKEALDAFNKFYGVNKTKNGNSRYKISGVAKARDIYYSETPERIITDSRYLANPSKWDFQGVDTGKDRSTGQPRLKPVRKPRAKKAPQQQYQQQQQEY